MKLKDAIPMYHKWKEASEKYETSRQYYSWYYSYMQEFLSKNWDVLKDIEVEIDKEELRKILAW